MVILKGKKFLIYGFGLSGKSCFRFLNKNNYNFIANMPSDKRRNYITKLFDKNFQDMNAHSKIFYDYLPKTININGKNENLFFIWSLSASKVWDF